MFERKQFEIAEEIKRICDDKILEFLNLIEGGDCATLTLQCADVVWNDVLEYLKSKKAYKNVDAVKFVQVANIEQELRQYIDVRTVDEFKVVEGQLTSMSEYEIKLKTQSMETKFEIGKRIRDELQREKVCVGDVIKIYVEIGFVVKQGRGLSFEAHTLNEDVINLPAGECWKTEKHESVLTLSEIDKMNMFKGEESILSNVKDRVNLQIDRWLKEEKIKINLNTLIVHNVKNITSEQIQQIIYTVRKMKYLRVVFLQRNATTKPTCLNLCVDLNKIDVQKYLETFLSTYNYKANKNTVKKLLKVDFKTIDRLIQFVRFVTEDRNVNDANIDKYAHVLM